jgi:beta-lactamase class A
MRVFFLTLLLLFGLAGPVRAQEAEAGLRARAEQVVELLRGGGDPAALFTPAFLAQVPPDQVRAVSRQLADQYGAVRALAGLDAASPQAGVIHVAFERGTVHMRIVLEPDPPGRVAGLLVTGAETRGDSLSGVVGEMRALPGATSLAVARLGTGAPEMLASLEPGRPMAIGSAFKLFILAELTRQVQAGRRHWSDVVALDRHSIPTGSLQTWPLGAPVTLHTLAALMISVSDNTAADVLLHTLGRENVERMMTTIGIADPARNIPFLSTLEVSTLKTAPAPALNAWLQADAAGRRQLLARDYANLDPARVDISRLEGGPLHIDNLEWFASTADLIKAMDWLRRNGDDTARAILAINGALGPNSGGFAYAGYKGGSEAGVLNLTWLVRNRAGVWHALSGTWNNPSARLEEGRFIGLMARVAQQLR